VDLLQTETDRQFNKEREVVVIVGKTGQGKSYWTKKFLRTKNRVVIVDPMFEYERSKQFDEFDELVDYVQDKKIFRVSYNNLADFPFLCQVVWELGKCYLVIEESQRVLPGGARPLPEEFEQLLYRGRHRDVSVVLVAQRASTIHIAARSQWSRLIVFKQTEPKDLSWIADTTGYDLEEKIRTLKEYHHFEITPKTCHLKFNDQIIEKGST
jgi:DNA helicase HerA-like ATPase